LDESSLSLVLSLLALSLEEEDDWLEDSSRIGIEGCKLVGPDATCRGNIHIFRHIKSDHNAIKGTEPKPA
jgi:hypothetical protein